MNDNAAYTFTNREFVAMVRAELAAAGRSDVAISRSWIVEDEPGYRFLLNVPIGSELVLPLRTMNGFFEARTDEDRRHHARQFASALINLKSAEATLQKYVRDMRRSANATIAAAREAGLDVSLDRIGLKPTHAYQLSGGSWKEAATFVLAEVTIRHTTFFLRPGTSVMWIADPEDFERDIADILEEQRERQTRMTEMDAIGADLLVDGLTLDLLAAHEIDASKALREVWAKQHVSYRVDCLGQETSLSLISSDGIATASITMPGGFWNGENLWLAGTDADEDHSDLVGRSLGDLVPHPAFTSRRVVSVESRPVETFSFDLSDKSMFDADTGRIWREERLAA